MATKKKRTKPRIAKPAPRKRVKAGTSKAAAAHKKILYVNALLANGGNTTQAALKAGYKPGRAAEQAGWRLSKDVEVSRLLRDAHQKAAGIAGLEVERTLLEIARVAYVDPGNLFDIEGKLIPVKELSADMRAAVASAEIEPVYSGRGRRRSVAYYIKKIKLWDKNAALEKAMKFHGLYREDNDQTRPVIVNSINYADMHKPKKAA